MKQLLFILLLLTLNARAASCSYKISPHTTKVTWKAYKTPKKVAVEGELRKFKITPKESSAKSLDDLILGTKFDIDASSISTNNPARDQKIVKNFFESKGKVITIKGEVQKVIKDEVLTKLTLKETGKDVLFTKKKDGKKVRLEATINVLDYDLETNLEKLSSACKALHEGMTWPDVNVAIEFEAEESCRP